MALEINTSVEVNTGAVATYWIVGEMFIYAVKKQVRLTLFGYVDKSAFQDSKAPLTRRDVVFELAAFNSEEKTALAKIAKRLYEENKSMFGVEEE